MKSINQQPRHGATIVLMLILLVVVFSFVAFAIDTGRIQYAQLKLQSASDLAVRAGAEAMARGVGDVQNIQDFDGAIRDEVNMLMQKNTLFGGQVTFDASTQLQFGMGDPDPGSATGKYMFNSSNNLTIDSNALSVQPDLGQFPLVFGKFLGTHSVDLRAKSTAKVQERDIVVVLDKSGSMMELGAGTIPLSSFPANLFQVEDALYESGDAYYPGGPYNDGVRTSEFEQFGGDINLTKMQALKYAIYSFRQIIDQTPGNEKLGMTSYSDSADLPSNAPNAPGAVDIQAGLSQSVFDAVVTDGICDNYATPMAPTETTASALEGKGTNYDKFDFNYLKMRWSGATNIVDGIEVGVDILFDPATRRPTAQPILIVLTDGNHNTVQAGNAASPDIAAQNAMNAHPNLKIYTITFGTDADQPAMDLVATTGGGRHMHADDVTALVEVFQDLAANAGVTMIE